MRQIINDINKTVSEDIADRDSRAAEFEKAHKHVNSILNTNFS